MNNDSGTVEMHIDPQGFEHYRSAEVSIQDDTLLASIYGRTESLRLLSIVLLTVLV